jgi:Lamin Tail Domain
LSLHVRFSSGAIYVNEIASAGDGAYCAGADYIELFNADPTPLNIGGYSLSDSSNTFIIPSPTNVPAGGFVTYCEDLPGSFTFGISSTDTITLKNPSGVVLFSTVLNGQGTTTNTYQRLPDGSYGFGPPSPDAANVVPLAAISEVALGGTSDASVCGGGPYVELTNIGPGTLSLKGFKLLNLASLLPPPSYTFGAGDSVTSGEYTIFCQSTTFKFDIDFDDILTLRNANGDDVSKTVMGGVSPLPKKVDLVWARLGDSFQYSKNPTPGKPNVFPFEPSTVNLKNCGIQASPLPCLNDYELKETLLFDGYRTSPEFSGGTVDGSTCNHLIVNDEGNIFDMSISGGAVQLKRTIPFIGGTRDNEGMCYYSPGKIAVVDERERSGTFLNSTFVFIDNSAS